MKCSIHHGEEFCKRMQVMKERVKDMLYEEQKKEMATIKPRTIQLNLSDADCERIMKQAGRVGLTVSQLLEKFIGDLVCGTYSNGSDERDKAVEWFERTFYYELHIERPNSTLLKYFLSDDYGIQEMKNFLDTIGNIKRLEEEVEWAKDSESGYTAEELECTENELKMERESYDEVIGEWLKLHNFEPNMTEEIERCEKWIEAYEKNLLYQDN